MLTEITIIDIANKIIGNLSASTALEIGVGEGGILARLNVPCGIGVDHYEPALKLACQNFPRIALLKYDIRKIGDIFIDKSFDVVIGFDILEHFDSTTIPELIGLCERLSKKMVMFWMPLEKTLAPNLTPENPSQDHLTLMDIADFNARGYELIRFPHYWRNEREDPTIDGLLCFKRMA